MALRRSVRLFFNSIAHNARQTIISAYAFQFYSATNRGTRALEEEFLLLGVMMQIYFPRRLCELNPGESFTFSSQGME